MAKKILIIEDEELLHTLLQRKLTNEGYDVFTAGDGEEGLKTMQEIKPDLILLDIVMPKIGGFEVMAEMSKNPELSKIPIIIISNSGQPVELDRAKKLGARDCLVKTDFNPEEVVAKIKEHIGK